MNDEPELVDAPDLTQEQEEQLKQVIGPDGEPTPALGLVLGIEKFRYPNKHYRLIWVLGEQAWFAEEETTPFKRKREALEAGRELVERVGAAYLSEVTR